MGLGTPDQFGVLIVVAVLLLVAGRVLLRALFIDARRNEVEAWAKARGFTFKPRNDPTLAGRFPAFACLQQGSKRYAYNVVEGTRSGRRFLAFDYNYEVYSYRISGRTTSHHDFSGVILTTDVPLKPLYIRAEESFDRLDEFLGFDDIDFESAEFSRKFYVKSPDKRWAYDVLHARTMQFLLDQPRFTIEFEPRCAIAYRGSTFAPSDFEDAAATLAGVIDAFPEYLVRQQKESV